MKSIFNLRVILPTAVFLISAAIVIPQKLFGKDIGMIEKDATSVIDEYTAKYIPLDLARRAQWYKYATTGDKEAAELNGALELKIKELASDRERFAKIKAIYDDRREIADPIIKRQIEIIYLSHLPNQVAPDKLKRLNELEQRIQQTFNDYRAEIDGKKLSPVDVSHILSDSKDSSELERVWKSQQSVAKLLESDFRSLVKLRNEIARDLGYKGAIDLTAEIAEFDLKMLDKFYSDVAKYTDAPFKRLKNDVIDPTLAKRYGIGVSELKPWHYQNQFFQEAPTSVFGTVDVDGLYAKSQSQDVIDLAEELYGSMGVDITGIIKRSSLFPKPGKNPHAVAELLDPTKANTSVLIMNLPPPPAHPKASEASTLIHELGHDINYESIMQNKALPYLLRSPTMLTEAFAMLMEDQTWSAEWFDKLGVDKEKARAVLDVADRIDYMDQLIFLRWSSTIYCFERKFYADPDIDIGDTWWSCRERHQLMGRPDGWINPDALAKYHIPNIPPLYYSNYAIGRVANVQFAELVAKRIGADPNSASYFGKKDLGRWLMDDFLAQGERLRWSEFLKLTTGKEVSVEAWKKHYIGSEAEKRLYEK